MARFLCGTCGWSDHTDFYPAGMKPTERLPYYAARFPLVEVDSTYYAIPPKRNFEGWAARTPREFTFNVKAYAALTRHIRQPKPEDEDFAAVLARFVEAVSPLTASGKLKALHFQFPPWFPNNEQNRAYLRELREALPGYLIAVEFRHRSWFSGTKETAQTLEFLAAAGFVHVVCDEPQIGTGSVPPVTAVTNSELAIVRFHGRNAGTWYKKGLASTGDRFNYLYSQKELESWLERLAELGSQAREVHVLMNNNFGNYAVLNARQMMEILAAAGLAPAPPGNPNSSAGTAQQPEPPDNERLF